MKWSKRSHDYYAFEYGCWSSGQTKCRGKEDCGSDRKGLKYERTITVPKCLPDGVYIFGAVWFGGLEEEYRGTRRNYWSCSNIRIQGGSRMTKSCQPKFIPGDDKDSCLANTDAVGEPPRISRRRRVPRKFADGRRPKTILAEVAMKDFKSKY